MSHTQPDHGGRVLFERRSVDATTVEYAVTLFAGESEHHATVTIGADDGSIDVGEWDGSPPEWLGKYVRQLARQMVSKNQKEDVPVWPRRLLRWKDDRGKRV